MRPITTSTGSVLVLKNGFNDETRQQPIWKLIESVADWHDAREHDEAGLHDLYSTDFTVNLPHGEHVESPDGHTDEGGFKVATAKYYTEPLKENRHQIEEMIALEKAEGWQVWINAIIFADIQGTPTDGETKVKDENGREWDMGIPTFYLVEAGYDGNSKDSGLKVKHITFIKDTGLVNDKLDLRGVGHHRSA